MDFREQLHKLVDEFDDESVKSELRARIDNLDDESLPAALTDVRALHELFAMP